MANRTFFSVCIGLGLIFGAFVLGYIRGVSVGQKWPTDGIGQMTDDVEANAVLIANLTDRLIYLEEWATMETWASHYGGRHNGRVTASGTVFDENELTAASPWLPFGKWVKVTNIENGLSVNVKITDRGPAVRLGRGLDLSTAAAEAIGLIRPGVTKVRIAPAL